MMKASIPQGNTSQKSNRVWLSVEFHMHSQIPNGYIHVQNELRLLDILNATGPADAKSGYIEFMTVVNPSGDGYVEARDVRKAAICVATTSDANVARGAGGKPSPRPYPTKEKSHVRISLETPDLSMVGTMHGLPFQTIADVLDENTPFLPLTDVTMAREGHLYGERPFVAVRKDQILLLKEEKLT
jgi:hypothetical protein